MRWLGYAIFLTLFLIVAGGVNFYLYRRMVTLLDIDSRNLLWLLRFSFLLLAISYPTARMMVRSHINVLSASWFWISSIWMGIALYWFFVNLLAHLFITVLRIFGKYNSVQNAAGMSPGTIVFAVVLAVTLAISSYAIFRAYGRARVSQLEIPLKNLPPELDGFTIAHISDVHLGIIMGRHHARRIVDQVNSLEPDLIVITGDLIDENPEELDDIFDELGNLRAKHGVFAVTGNHEFYNKARRIVSRCADVGIRYLRNEKVVVAGGIHLYGIDDPTVRYMGGKSVPFNELIEVIDSGSKTVPSILLSHQPSRFGKAAGLGIDLMLSGHTHNGQLWPIVYIVRRFFPRVYGHYTRGDSHLYVSSGIGVWGPPMRFGAPPEIAKIRLRTKN